MKKKALSALIAASMILSSGPYTTWASSNAVNKVYADVYGIDIMFDSNASSSDYADLSVTDSDGSQIAFTSAVEDNFVHVNFTDPIQPDSTLMLKIMGETKQIEVKKEYFLDFESNAISTTGSSTIYANNWSFVVSAGNGAFITDSDAFTGTSSKRLVITDGAAYINNDKITLPTDITVSVDLAGFNRTYCANGKLSTGYTPRIAVRSKAKNYLNSYSMDLMSTGTARLGIHDYDNTTTGRYSLISGYKEYKPDGGITIGDIYTESADPSATDSPNNNGFKNNLEYEVKTQAPERKYVVRNYDNIIEGYVDGGFVGMVKDESSRYTSQQVVFQSTSQSAVTLDNILVTSCTVTDIEKVLAIGSYADKFHFELQTSVNLPNDSIVGLDGVSLVNKDTGEAVELSEDDITTDGKKIRFNVALTPDNTYEFSAKAGFGAGSRLIEEDYDTTFTVATLWSADFDTVPDSIIGTLVRSNVAADSLSNLKIKDGKLWATDSAIAPMADALATEENVTFSYDANYYAALNRSEFQSSYTRTAPYMYIGFNAENLVKSTTDTRFFFGDILTKKYGWYDTNKQVQRAHNAAYYTITEPAEGTDYNAGDTYYAEQTAFFRPSTQTGTISGVGTVNYGEHYKFTSSPALPYGDAYFDSSTKTYTVYAKGETLPEAYTSVSSTGVTVSERDSETVTTRIEKLGNTGTIIHGDTVIDTYNTGDVKTTGYFAIQSTAPDITAYDNMLITAYHEIKAVDEINLINADQKGIVLSTSSSLGALSDFDGLSVSNAYTGEAVELTGYSYMGNNLYIDCELEKDTPYSLKIEKGFAGETGTFIGNVNEFFKVAEVLSVDGANKDQLSKIGITPYNTSSAYRVINDDHIELLGTNITTDKYENASISFKLAYYSDAENAGTYASNYIKGGAGSFKATVNNSEVSIPKGAIQMYLSKATTNSTLVSIGTADGGVVKYREDSPFLNNAVIAKGVFVKGTDDDGNISMTYSKVVSPHTERYLMTGDNYRVYSDDTLIYEFDQPGLSQSGYVQIGGSSRGVTWLYNVEITQMEKLDSIALQISKLTADANAIYVKFDNTVQNVTDFSKISLKADGKEIGADFAATGNVVTIVPNGGIVSDAVYSITIESGFGPSEIIYTDEEYQNKFSVTIYENETFENGAPKEDSLIKITRDATYTDGGAVFVGAMGIDSPRLKAADDYTVKFDYKVYTASMNHTDSGKNYDSQVPYSLMWYNASSISEGLPTTAYYWYMQNARIVPYTRVNGTDTALTAAAYPEGKTVFGDAYQEDDGTITLFEEGYDFIENDYIFEDSEGEIVSNSLRTPELYQYEIDKSGAGASVYRNDSLIHTFTGDESADVTSTTGYFVLYARETEFIWVDNVQAYTFKEIRGITSELDLTNKKITLDNNSGETKDVAIVVAAYDANNMMIDSYMSDISEVENGITEVPFEIADGAASYSVFVWNNLTDLVPYCKTAKTS